MSKKDSVSDTENLSDNIPTQSDDESAQQEETGREDEVKMKEKKSNPGIVYLSRIPPFMKPHKIRHIFSQHGGVGRVYLQPEDAMVHKRRVKFGGNKKTKFVEGWVEFLRKQVAKTVAMALNNTPVARKKRSYYHDDLWNLKYLPKFRWTHLAEKIAYEQAVREQKMRTEMSQAKKESAHYLANVDKSKEIEAIVERKRKRGDMEDEVAPSLQRHFKQRKVAEVPSKVRQREVHGPVSSRLVPSDQGSSSRGDPKRNINDSLLRKIFS